MIWKDEVIERLDCKDVAERYGIKVNSKRMCSCPFHGQDKHPSMKMYEKTYHCFTCNEHGSAINLTMRLFDISFQEALSKLNIDFNLGFTSDYDDDEIQERITRYNIKQEIKRQIKENIKKINLIKTDTFRALNSRLETLNITQRELYSILERELDDSFKDDKNAYTAEIDDYLNSLIDDDFDFTELLAQEYEEIKNIYRQKSQLNDIEFSI